MSGQTVAEKILSRHAGKTVAADDLTVIDVDAAPTSTATTSTSSTKVVWLRI